MIILFNLESTCWPPSEKEGISEIIRIDALKLNSNNTVTDSYGIFIKPIINPILSKFCKNLTGITQKDLNNSTTFLSAIDQFNLWIGNDTERIVTWGTYDKHQIHRESFLKKYNGDLIDKLSSSHKSMKDSFKNVFNLKNNVKFSDALKMCNIPLNGQKNKIRSQNNVEKLLELYLLLQNK